MAAINCDCVIFEGQEGPLWCNWCVFVGSWKGCNNPKCTGESARWVTSNRWDKCFHLLGCYSTASSWEDFTRSEGSCRQVWVGGCLVGTWLGFKVAGTHGGLLLKSKVKWLYAAAHVCLRQCASFSTEHKDVPNTTAAREAKEGMQLVRVIY